MDDARAGRSLFLGDVNYSGFASDDDSGCALDEYAWVPPGLSPEQVGNLRTKFSTVVKWTSVSQF